MDHPTESQPEMRSEIIIMWTNIYVYLPLTALVIILVFCLVKREQTPLIYYINLLISNLIQLIVIIFLRHGGHPLIFHIILIAGVMASVYFRMIIAMERCFVITRPQWNWIRQTGKSVLVSVLVWILCIATGSLSMAFSQIVPVLIFGLLPALLFIFFLAWTFKALPAATSVPTDEKRRIAGTLVLLFIQYFLMVFFPFISSITAIFLRASGNVLGYIIIGLFLLSRYVDLTLAFFLRKGPVDKLLLCLCCCITDNTAEDVAGHQQLHKLMLQREREREKVKQTV